MLNIIRKQITHSIPQTIITITILGMIVSILQSPLLNNGIGMVMNFLIAGFVVSKLIGWVKH